MDLILIYVTCPSTEVAKAIASKLLERRMIACANLFENVNSIYRWQGKVVDDNETVLLLKTSSENFETVKTEIEKQHPYEIPCILGISVRSNESFGKWLTQETTD